ncbi:Alpha-glucosidase [Bienertia sinuspersici]
MFNYSNSMSVSKGKYVNLGAPTDYINVHIREGNIVALVGEALTARATQSMPFYLLVFMSNDGARTRDLFLDDGVDINMRRCCEWRICHEPEMDN